MTVAKLTSAAAILALSAGIAGAEGKLSLYHWFEYMPQELLDRFSEETGIEVTMDTYDSNEALLASLKGGTLGSYDVAVPGDYMVQIMRDEGVVIQPYWRSTYRHHKENVLGAEMHPTFEIHVYKLALAA